MGKYYIVEEAELVCQYGSKRCKLRPGKTRHICGEEGRRLANISDIYPENFEKDFDSCCSPYQINYKEMNGIVKGDKIRIRGSIHSTLLHDGTYGKQIEVSKVEKLEE